MRISKELLGIGELARRSGISTSAIRFYERRGLIAPAGRTSGRRVYEEASLRRLVTIRTCAEAGFKLGEIGTLLRGTTAARIRMAARKRDDLHHAAKKLREAQKLIDAFIECGCRDLDSCARLHNRPRRQGPAPDR